MSARYKFRNQERIETIYQVADLVHNQTSRRLARWGYLQTAKHQYQIKSVNFVTDTSDFDLRETISQNWPDINKHSILDVYLDDEMKIKQFNFFDNQGQYCYQGPAWRPCK